jgi:hypothetical protein
MAQTVPELRDDIRTAVDRYERVESTAFTKEALAAICAALDDSVGSGQLPPKAEMRGRIMAAIEADAGGGDPTFDRPFRKAELEAIRDALEERG